MPHSILPNRWSLKALAPAQMEENPHPGDILLEYAPEIP